MKKLVLAFLIVVILGGLGFYFYSARAIDLIINDKQVELDNPVIIEEDTIFVPAKPIFEELGAYTRWDSKTGFFTAKLGDFQMRLPVDSDEVTIDGETVAWAAPVQLVNDTVYTPVGPTAEALGAFVEWDEETREVIVSTPQEFDPEIGDEQEEPLLHVAYPPEQQISYYADSLFVFGTTRSYSQVDVTVNGEPVDMLNRKTGNFLTMVDIPRGEEFTLTVEASDGVKTTTVKRSVIFPEGLQTMPEEPLEIHSSHLIPRQDQILNPGESLRIVARGSPGATAYYQIGEGSYNEMKELEYPAGPSGRGGIYTAVYTAGQYDAPAAGVSDSMPITVFLEKGEEQVSKELPGKVAFFSDIPYKIVEVKEEPELNFSGWFRIIQDDQYQLYADTRGGTGYPDNVASYLTEGTHFETVGTSGDYYRVKLEENETYLLHKEAVRELDEKDFLEPFLSDIEISETGEEVSLRLIADERFPFIIGSSTDKLEIKLYGVEKDEGLAVPEAPNSVKEVTLEPVAGEPNAFLLSIILEQNFTSFTPSWDNNDLTIEVNKPPEISEESSLKDKTIVIDPGHGGEDPGAPGPGDLYEKDVVLDISLYLRDLLLEEGADVIMTRTEDVNIDLYDRPKAEHLNETDFFISVHANAHGPGADAVDTHGIMTLYNYDHNEKVAEIMLNMVSEKMDLPAVYTSRRNIAVTRYTQFPCVLVEAGYMMHPEDNWHILHPMGQQEFARAMKEGIKEYFVSFDKVNNTEQQ
ncbi:MAG: N-acetylmuramoyl-L-alanine amidase [Bacillota bacterium]